MVWLSRRSLKQTGHPSGKLGVVGQKLIFFLTKHKLETNLNLRPLVPRSAVCQRHNSCPPPNNLAGSFFTFYNLTFSKGSINGLTHVFYVLPAACLPQARFPRWEAPDGLLWRALSQQGRRWRLFPGHQGYGGNCPTFGQPGPLLDCPHRGMVFFISPGNVKLCSSEERKAKQDLLGALRLSFLLTRPCLALVC